MKKYLLVSILMLFSLTISLGLFAEEKGKTVQGTLVDTKCYVTGGFKVNEHMGVKDCGTMCAKSGIPVGVLDAKGNLYTVLAPAPAFADHIGQEARVTGKVDVKGKHVVPDKIEVKRGDKWEEVKAQAMM